MEYLHQIVSAMEAALAASPLPWEHRLVLLHAAAEAGTALATLILPMGLLYLAARRRDLEYRGLLMLFAGALLTTAVAHAFAGWALWWPDPLSSGVAKASAALLLLATAVAFLRWLPRARHLPSPSQLRRANASLSREAFEQQQELRASRALATVFKQAMLQADTALALVTPGGVWADVNPRFLALLGSTRETLEPPIRLLGKDYAREQGSLSLEGCGSDGLPRPVRLHWQALALEDRHLGWLVQATDTSAEQAHKNALARQRKELEAQAAEQQRTLAATSARLEQEMEGRRQALLQVKTLAEQLMRTNARVNQIDERIGTLAHRDPATGLGTRYAFADRLSAVIAQSRRYGEPLSVLLLAPDPVEGLSPPAALVAAAKTLTGDMRETDVAGVLDEQHLAVLLPHTDPGQALEVAERFRRTVTEKTADKSPRLSCCIGVAAWRPGQAEEDLIRAAADALRQARGNGRNRVAFGPAVEAART